MNNHVIYDYTANTEPVTVPPEKQMWFRCTHCGERFMLVVPASIRLVVAVGKEFTRDHQRCRPRPIIYKEP